jgi:hypothetical protein
MKDYSRLDPPRSEDDRTFFSGTIMPMAWRLWGYRRFLALSLTLAVLIAGFALALLYLSQPIERSASIPFRLVFEGAEEQKYPSGVPFSSTDIVSTPVLNAVFEINDLEKYIAYESFANRVFVLEVGRDAELLTMEYTSRLADPQLSAIDRVGLEREFRERLQAIRLDYTLTFISPHDGWQMPSVVVQKLLTDILGTWASHAAERRGALEYQKPLLLSRASTDAAPRGMDLIAKADTLRVQLTRLARNIEEIQQLPGGNVVRSGSRDVSLPEIRAQVEDMLAYRVQPLLRTLIGRAVERDRRGTLRYLESQVARTSQEADAAAGHQQAIVNALLTYVTDRTAPAAPGTGDSTPSPAAPGATASMPQLSDSFIDRLMKIGSRTEDVEFRQELVRQASAAGLNAVTARRESAFYVDLLAAARAAGTGSPDPRGEDELAAMLDALSQSALGISEEARDLYATISASNLNPRSALYTVTGPFQLRTHRPLPVDRVMTYLILVLLATVVLVSAGCLIDSFVRAPQVTAEASGPATPLPGEAAARPEERQLI